MSGSYCGPYYKPMTIANDDSRVVRKLETSLTGDARVVIYDCHVFIVQATDQVFWIWVYFKIEGVELLIQKVSRSASFGAKVMPSLQREDSSFVNSVTGSVCRA